jgi:polysaccharide export outer membrane protein
MVSANADEAGSMSTRKPPSQNHSELTPTPEGFENLMIASGDLLHMEVYNTPEMDSDLRVDGHGDVTIPLIGSIHIAGDTIFQAQRAIAREFVDQEILKSPQVTLNVLQFASRNISVLGEVQSPGRVQLLSSEPLGNVLALAGGETLAAGNDIEIQRRGDDGKLTTTHVKYAQGSDPDSLQSVMVDPGDTVLVHRAGVIYILGAVTRPGGYLMVNSGSLSVVEAVSLAQGTTLQASTRWAFIVRRQGDGFIQFKVPLGKMETGGATPVELKLNDVLYIPTSTWKAVLINGSNVLSAATSAAIYKGP